MYILSSNCNVEVFFPKELPKSSAKFVREIPIK